MNHLTRQFIDQYERENPNFRRMYCPVADLYDADLDMFPSHDMKIVLYLVLLYLNYEIL